MAGHSRESLLDDDIMEELHEDRLSGAPSDCDSDKVIMMMMMTMTMNLDPQRHRKAEKGRGSR
jgi:hypothetical protein